MPNKTPCGLPFQHNRSEEENSEMRRFVGTAVISGAEIEGLIAESALISVPEVLPLIIKLGGDLRDDIYRSHKSCNVPLQLHIIRNCFCYAFAKGAEMAFLWNLSGDGKIEFSYNYPEAVLGRAGARVSDKYSEFTSRGMISMAVVFDHFKEKVLLDPDNGLPRGEDWAEDLMACGFYWAAIIGLHAGMKKMGFS